MNAISACPDRLALREYLLGRTSEATAAAVEEHLASCLKCQQQLPAIHAEDDFVADFRARAGLRQPNNPLLDRLAGNLRNLLRPDSPMTRDATPPGDGEATPPPAGSAANDADDLRTLLAPPREPDELGRLGSYRILKVLGAGGMGVVFLAEDVQLRRKVAVKAMRPALATRATARQRFVREAQLTAALSHDHVVAIHQVGEENGVPFLAMPLLEGESLDARLKREGRLPVGEVLRIGREAAEGLAAAHEHGLIHRDVKPANLWLEGGRGRVKVLDFGLARASDGDAHLTQTGVIMGTPAYMAPEQAGGSVDHRADLFGLGCVLYRMATGKLPFPGDTVYEVMAKIATERPRPPRELNAEVPPALSDLIVRLLAKDRTARPESASAVVAALKELQERAVEAIPLARPVAPREEATDPWATLTDVAAPPAPAPVRRRRWRGAALLALGGALMAGIIVIIYDKNHKEAGRLTLPDGWSVETEQDGNSAKPEPLPPSDSGAPMVPTALVAAPAKLDGVQSWTIETVPPRGEMWAVQLSPDGKLLAAGGDDGTVRLWDTTTGRLARALITGQGQIQFLAWLPDNKMLAVGSAENGSIAIWDTVAGRVVRKIGTDAYFRSVYGLYAALSPDGQTLAVRMGLRIELWDTTSGKRLGTSPELNASAGALVWSPDGGTLALGLSSKDVKLWPVAEQQFLTLTGLKSVGDMCAVGWSSDGKSLAAGGGHESEIGIWDVASRKLLRKAEKQSDQPLVGLQWVNNDHTLQLFYQGHSDDLDSNTGKVTCKGPEFVHVGSNLGRGGSRDSTTGWAGHRGELWWTNKVKDKETQYYVGMLRPPRGMTWSPSGDKVVSLGGRLTLWLPAQGTMIRGYEQQNAGGWGELAIVAAFSSDEKRLAAGDVPGGLLWVYDTRNGQQVTQPQAHQGWCRAVAWSPDGKWIATAGDDKVVRTWAAESYRPARLFEGHEKLVTTVAWSPDSKTLASGSGDGTVRLWDVAAGKQRRTLKTGLPGVNSVAWSPDGKALAVAGNDSHAQVWSAESGDPLPCQATFSHDGGYSVCWSADSATLVCTGGRGGWGVASRLYDTKTWEIQREVAGSSLSPDLSLYFAPDGYRLCETKTGRCVGSLVPLHGGTGIAISADGHYHGTIKDPEKKTEQIVYVIQTDKGQETLTPEEFEKRFRKNDPDKVRLIGR